MIQRSCFLFLLGILVCFNSTVVFAEPELSPLPAQSSFNSDVEHGNYPSAKASPNTPELRWDFSGTKVYPYDFIQKVSVENAVIDMSEESDRGSSNQKMTGNGKLSLKSEGNNTARFVIEDLLMEAEIEIAGEEAPKTMKTQAPPIIIQGVKEDGTMELGYSSQELLLQTLFPIPPKPLKVGEQVVIAAEMPFNAMGSLLHVKGASEITLADYVEINGRKCAKLVTIIDISDMNIPPELKGEYKCQVKGKSVFYFDIENRHFVSGRVAMIMSMRIDAPMPKMAFPDEEPDENMPERIQMSMDNDNFLSVDFIEN